MPVESGKTDNRSEIRWHVEIASKTDNSVLSFDVVFDQSEAVAALESGRMVSHVAAMYAGAYVATLGEEIVNYRLKILEARHYSPCCAKVYDPHTCENNLVSLGALGLYCSICDRPILP